MDELYLVYVHQIGADYKGVNNYQFIFSDKTEGIDGEGWDEYPAGGNPYPPSDEIIKQVGTVSTDELTLILLQNNEQFSMWDGVDGVIALAWEDIEGLEEYPENRVYFNFGTPITDVSALLYERDIVMKYEKTLTNGQK